MGASSRGWGIIHQTAPLHVTCVPAIHGLPATAGVWISSQPAGAPQRVPSGESPGVPQPARSFGVGLETTAGRAMQPPASVAQTRRPPRRRLSASARREG